MQPPQVPCKALCRPQLGQETGRGEVQRLLLPSVVEPVCTVYFHCWVGGIFPLRDGWCYLNLLVASRRADISSKGNFNIWELVVFRVLWLLIRTFHCRPILHAQMHLCARFLLGIHLTLTTAESSVTLSVTSFLRASDPYLKDAYPQTPSLFFSKGPLTPPSWGESDLLQALEKERNVQAHLQESFPSHWE